MHNCAIVHSVSPLRCNFHSLGYVDFQLTTRWQQHGIICIEKYRCVHIIKTKHVSVTKGYPDMFIQKCSKQSIGHHTTLCDVLLPADPLAKPRLILNLHPMPFFFTRSNQPSDPCLQKTFHTSSLFNFIKCFL